MTLRRLLLVALASLLVLHQDVWNWTEPRWIAGWPAGLAYHVGFCLAAAVLLAFYLRAEHSEGPRD